MRGVVPPGFAYFDVAFGLQVLPSYHPRRHPVISLSGHSSLLQEGYVICIYIYMYLPQEGYAHVVENEAEWKAEFGRDVLEGLLDHPDAGSPSRSKPKPEPEPKTQP